MGAYSPHCAKSSRAYLFEERQLMVVNFLVPRATSSIKLAVSAVGGKLRTRRTKLDSHGKA